MDKHTEMLTIISELRHYVELDGTEFGEAGSLMCQLASYSPYVSEKFLNALVKELHNHLNNYKENSKIVEVTVTETVEHKVKRLEWNNAH